MSGFAVAGATSAVAQDPAATPAPDPCEATAAVRGPIEEKIRTNYNTQDINLRKEVNNAGDGYLKTYANDACEAVKAFATYLNGYLPGSKDWVTKTERKRNLDALFAKWAPATRANNWDESYNLGKQILAIDPDALNVILVMGSIGLDETLKTPRITKYNDDTLKYAKIAIEKLNAGKTSNDFGFHTFTYAVRDAEKKAIIPASKENALGWMNYTIGAVTYFGLNNKKDSLPYLYKATQLNSQTKTLPQVYGILGDYYFDEVVRLGEEIKTKTIEAGMKDTDETKALIALQKGYTERAIDAYARAQNAVPTTDTARKAYRDGIGKRIETLYKVRFDNVDGIAAFVKTQLAKPLPDPTVAPTPIIEAEPDPATTGTPATTTGTKPATPGTTVKPVTAPATNGTKPAVTAPATTKKPVSANGVTTGPTTASVKPAIKKPVVKKKGTR
jgi:tetratricopeptide (TPR) repeat protein